MSLQTRIYTSAGVAVFFCEGHPIHRAGHRMGTFPADHPAAGHPVVIGPDGAYVDGEEHHSITFSWVPGCVHIDDHDPHPLRGCDRGCEAYVFVGGRDPRRAPHRNASRTELLAMIVALTGGGE